MDQLWMRICPADIMVGSTYHNTTIFLTICIIFNAYSNIRILGISDIRPVIFTVIECFSLELTLFFRSIASYTTHGDCFTAIILVETIFRGTSKFAHIDPLTVLIISKCLTLVKCVVSIICS